MVTASRRTLRRINDIGKPTLRELRSQLRERRITTFDLIMETLDCAMACKEQANAFSIIAKQQALTAAAESHRRYLEGTHRPLEGIPITVKDIIETAGIETRYGSTAYIGHVPVTHAAIVQQLVDQGVIIIGKTTTHEFAWGVTTTHAIFGPTLNPLDHERISGGSSGGAAAAVAFGVNALALGTDTGGSSRIPAALCGVLGFKPTFGIWSTTGIFTLSQSLDHPGLIGRCVDDITLTAEALGITTFDIALGTRTRIGVIDCVSGIAPSEPVASALASAVDAISVTFDLSEIEDDGLFSGAYEAFADLVLFEAGAHHFALNDNATIYQSYGAETIERINLAKKVTVGDYARCHEFRREFRRRIVSRMAHIDYLLLPTCPCVAPRHDEQFVNLGHWSGSIREALMAYTAPFNIAGLPAISIPVRTKEDSLPVAMQIVGKLGGDGALLAIARKIETILHEGT